MNTSQPNYFVIDKLIVPETNVTNRGILKSPHRTTKNYQMSVYWSKREGRRGNYISKKE